MNNKIAEKCETIHNSETNLPGSQIVILGMNIYFFQAYKSWLKDKGIKEEPRLPGIDLTPEQLFFCELHSGESNLQLSFVHVYCHYNESFINHTEAHTFL